MSLIAFLTVADIAAKLGVSRQRVHAIAQSRGIFPVRRVGITRVFAESDLRLFMGKNPGGRPRKLRVGAERDAKSTDEIQKERKDKAAAHNLAWRTKNKEKSRAHRILNKAVRQGVVCRGECECCGAIKSEGHHDDYSKPLEVRWLCHKCHFREHHSRKLLTGVTTAA